MTPAPVTDADARSAFAILAMFGAEPSDRAMDGWGGDGWLAEELAALGGVRKDSSEEGDAVRPFQRQGHMPPPESEVPPSRPSPGPLPRGTPPEVRAAEIIAGALREVAAAVDRLAAARREAG